MVDMLLRAFLSTIERVMDLWPTARGFGPGEAPPLVVQYLAGAQGVADVASVLQFVTGLLLVFPALLAVKAATWLWTLLPGKAS